MWTILIGFLAGLIAKAISPGSGPSGFFMTAVLGIAGSLIATFLGEKLGLY
ncbi:GlsB/YeaQ/YmgE family stress response membrane protein, partial [Acinetobacter baumannii]